MLIAYVCYAYADACYAHADSTGEVSRLPGGGASGMVCAERKRVEWLRRYAMRMLTYAMRMLTYAMRMLTYAAVCGAPGCEETLDR